MLLPFNKRTFGHERKGFSLVELLVVVLILGVLIGIALPLYLSSVKRSAIQAVKTNMKNIAKVAQVYRVNNGTYPDSIAALVGPGRDMEMRPSGPYEIEYEVGVNPAEPTEYLVIATETSEGALFNGGKTTAFYNLQTGQFTDIDSL